MGMLISAYLILKSNEIFRLPKYSAHDRTGDREHTLPLFRLSTVLVLDTIFYK